MKSPFSVVGKKNYKGHHFLIYLLTIQTFMFKSYYCCILPCITQNIRNVTCQNKVVIKTNKNGIRNGLNVDHAMKIL